MRLTILLLALFAASCTTKPVATSSDRQVVADPCREYLGEARSLPEEPSSYIRTAANNTMDTVDFWHLYRNGVQQHERVTLDSNSFGDCLMAAYFNDTMGFADSLHILLGSRRLMSIAGMPSTKFLNGVYPIPIPELFGRLATVGSDTLDLDFVFDTGMTFQSSRMIRVVR